MICTLALLMRVPTERPATSFSTSGFALTPRIEKNQIEGAR